MRSSLKLIGTTSGALVVAALFAAGVTTPAGADNRTLPMRFELRLEGLAAQCGTACATYIAASGAITADSPRDFKSFMESAAAQGYDLKGATVVMDSDGGSVLGAIALGREIRTAKLSTMVGRVVDLADQPRGSKIPRAKLSPYADCESMCAFLMLGGIKRTVPTEARVMVHQIWLGDRREDPTAANYSAEDLVLVQRDIGRLARFTEDMGASMDLLDLSLRIPPWEPLHVMSRDELMHTRLATEGPTVPEVAAAATTTTTTMATTAAPPARAPAQPARPMTNGSKPVVKSMPISEQRWDLVNRDGGMMLARRHPLTVEGDQIGSFDLMLSCGAGDKFEMSYVERRFAGDSLALPPQLDGVTLRIGKTRAALKIVASGREDQTLRTLAVGAVPAEVVRRFSAGFRSIVVETDSNDAVTVIRIGNTGAPQNFPQLAAACTKPFADRAEAVTVQKTGGLALAR